MHQFGGKYEMFLLFTLGFWTHACFIIYTFWMSQLEYPSNIIIIGSSLNMNTGTERILVLSRYNEPNLNRRKIIELFVPNQVT